MAHPLPPSPASGSAGPERATADDLLRHAAWIRALARGLVGDAASADDLVQEAYVAALRRPPERGASLRPWLRKVVLNAARQGFRGGERRARREELARPPSEPPDPAEWAQRLEAERRLTDALARLAEPFRSTLMLRYYEGLEPSEIALRTGTPAGTVRWRVKRGLELLRERLDEGFGSRPAWSLALLPLASTGARTGTGAAIAAGASAAALTGALAMNVVSKLAVATAACIALVYGLAWIEVLPRSVVPFLEERAAAVSFRPLARATAEPEALAAAPAVQHEPSRAPATLPAPPAALAPEPDSGPAPAIVHARAVDPAGNGLAGVTLRVAQGAGRAEARTGSDGEVELAVSLGRSEAQLVLELSAPGLASEGATAVARAGEPLHLGTLTLHPGGAVSGRVLDARGMPVAGARITLGDLSAPERALQAQRLQAAGFEAVPSTSTAAGGAFLLSGVRAGYARLWASAEGYLASFTPPVEVRAGEESFGLALVLEELAAENLVRGVVLDPFGAPVARAKLDFRHSSRSSGTTTAGEQPAEEDGTFLFKLPADGRLWVTARDPEQRYGPASASEVETGGPELVLALVEVRELELRVHERAGEPVERFGFAVVSEGGEFEQARAGRSQRAGGRASFGRPGGRFIVRIDAPGYALAEAGPFEPSFEGAVEVALERAPRLVGRVTERDGPVAGARVRLHPLVEEDQLYERNGFRSRIHHDVADEAETGADGSYLLTLRSPGTFIVRAERDGYAPCDAGPLELGRAGEQTLGLVLGRGGAIEGRVLLADGEDPGGRIVGLSRLDGYARTVRVGRDGSYRFERLTPGPWMLELRDAEIAPGTTITRTSTAERSVPFDELEWSCEVREGETTRFDLGVPASDACRLSGRFLVDGRLDEAWIAKLVPRTRSFMEDGGVSGVVRPGGAFELAVSEPGDYWLTLMRGVEGGEQIVIDELRLAPGDVLWEREFVTGSLAVEGAAAWDGVEVPQAVHLWGGPERLLVLTLVAGGEDGIARLASVPAGEGRLVRPDLRERDARKWETLLEVEVPRGGETRERLR